MVELKYFRMFFKQTMNALVAIQGRVARTLNCHKHILQNTSSFDDPCMRYVLEIESTEHLIGGCMIMLFTNSLHMEVVFKNSLYYQKKSMPCFLHIPVIENKKHSLLA